MKKIENQTFDMERALYGQSELLVKNCSFDGPADGESALKECSHIEAEHCFFYLRYPFWHDHGLTISHSEMTQDCRAALWYSHHVKVTDGKLQGICMEDSMAVSEYFMMRSEDLAFRRVQFQGKYSFQYIKNAVFEDCVFDTKDVFWHGIPII